MKHNELPTIAFNAWLKEVGDDILLTDLCIPGTHDTMTSSCDHSYYRTQNLSLHDQLNVGVRFFDIRLTRNLLAAHREWVSTISGEDIFEEFISFLKDNPSEFVLVRIQNANEKKDDFDEYKKSLLTLIEHYLDSLLLPLDDDTNQKKGAYRWPTVKEARGKIIVIECAPPSLNVSLTDKQVRWAYNWHENDYIKLQDNWDGPEVEQKQDDIKALLYSREKNPEILLLNHVSATNGSIGNPIGYANILNNNMFLELDHVIAINDSHQAAPCRDHRRYLKYGRGVLIYDFINKVLSEKTILVNPIAQKEKE